MGDNQLDRWARIRSHLCWSSPVLAPALAALTFVRAPTRVNPSGCPPWEHQGEYSVGSGILAAWASENGVWLPDMQEAA